MKNFGNKVYFLNVNVFPLVHFRKLYLNKNEVKFVVPQKVL